MVTPGAITATVSRREKKCQTTIQNKAQTLLSISTTLFRVVFTSVGLVKGAEEHWTSGTRTLF
jgi:hypothetical protein